MSHGLREAKKDLEDVEMARKIISLVLVEECSSFDLRRSMKRGSMIFRLWANATGGDRIGGQHLFQSRRVKTTTKHSTSGLGELVFGYLMRWRGSHGFKCDSTAAD